MEFIQRAFWVFVALVVLCGLVTFFKDIDQNGVPNPAEQVEINRK